MTESFEPLPPNNREAEECVLGSVLIDDQAFPLVASMLSADDFYLPANGAIWQACERLHAKGQPTDFVLVSDELGDPERLAYLARLLSVIPTAAHVEYYAAIVRQCSINRRVISAAGKIAQVAYENHPAATVAASATSILAEALRGASDGAGGPVALSALLEAYLASIGNLDDGPGRVYSGYRDLDSLTGGFGRGDLVVIGARTGVGKSTIALNLIRNAAVRFSLCGLIFSAEMSAHQIAQRFLSAESGVDSQRMRDGTLGAIEVGRITEAYYALKAASPVWVDDTPNVRLADILSRTLALHATNPLDLVVVDYLGLVTAPSRGQNRVEQIGEITKILKGLAREIDAPVLLLSQLNRAVEQRAGGQPMLSDLRESGSIEQDSDVVLLLTRNGEDGDDVTGRVNVIVAKNRNGPTGAVALAWNAHTTRFGDVVRGG